jgi:hypothetical protein
MLQQNLTGKWFVSIYSSSGNFLKTLYATDDQGVVGAVRSLINRAGQLSDNVDPDTDLSDDTFNCWS